MANVLLSVAVTPHTAEDRQRLMTALPALAREDPALGWWPDEATGKIVIGGAGELHLEVIVDRLAREFRVAARVGRPSVQYKETVRRPAEGEAKYSAQGDGRREYAHAKVRVLPRAPGSRLRDRERGRDRDDPTRFARAIEERIQDAFARGVVGGFPVEDLRVVIEDGSYHEADSSERAFRTAGALAFADAARKAKPVLLEPVMRVDVTAPADYEEEVVASLSGRGWHILARRNRNGAPTVTACVSRSAMFGLSTDLRDRTFGQGAFTMQLAGYQPLDRRHGPGDDSVVAAPLRPARPLRCSGIALPERDDGDVA